VTRALTLALALSLASAASARGSPAGEAAFFRRLTDAALAQAGQRVIYDSSYRRIPFPGGDVPADVGVCSDVVIRAYRAVGVDLQLRVHDDMARAFAEYPKLWGLRRPDANIDHRRVPNLETYLHRRGAQRGISRDPDAYAPGDLVVWKLAGNRPHIGIVVSRRSADGARPLVVHNAGLGPKLEDALFAFPITGHYRYRE
jgi:hypothetical protein